MKKFYFLTMALICSLVMLQAQSWEEIAKTLPTQPDRTSGNYGRSISIDGDYAVVGAPAYNENQGMAFVLRHNGTSWEQIAQLTASDGVKEDIFGYSVSISGDAIVVGAYYDDDKGTNSGSAYVFAKPTEGWTNMTETAKLRASDGATYDGFGNSVSISGDAIVIGAYGDDDKGYNSGSAYVFTKPTEGWTSMTETAKLNASDGAKEDSFGYSVSISGDAIVIGAYEDDDKGSSSGSAYVFTKPTEGWASMTETAKLTASDGTEYDMFGYSVSISGDAIVIGAHQDGDKGYYSGSAYVFTKPTEGWTSMTETAKLTASDGAQYDNFGYSVSISGNAIVIGAYKDDDKGSNSGSAYVFTKPTEGWTSMTETAKLTASDGAQYDVFGYSVSIGGNYILVHSPGNSDDYANNSSVYAFKKAGETWENASSSEEYSVTIETNRSNYYGGAVSIDGNYAVVGSKGYNGSQGIAYVLYRNGTNWETVAQLIASDGEEYDYFGSSVSISGDAIVIGAYMNDDKGSDSGAAYVFVKPTGGWTDMTETAKLTASDATNYDRFGNSVSISDDNIVIGAYGDDSYCGSAYVFTKPAEGWITMTETAKLTAFNRAYNDYFGESVSIDGDVIIVGADGDDDNEQDSGSAYVFTKPEGGWITMTETAKLTVSDATNSDRFGKSVRINNNQIIIGAYGKSSVYVFTKPDDGWTTMTETAKLTASDGPGAQFGMSVDTNGSVIVVGAWNDNKGGAAYVFNKPANGWSTATETTKLIASDRARYDNFGTTVSISGRTIVIGAASNGDKGKWSGSAYFYALMCKVSFVNHEGVLIEEQNVQHGSAATAPTAPSREGYTFTGWDVAFDNVTADITVTAQYTINTYTVRFEDFDGTLIEEQSIDYGSSATAPAEPTREGYTFTGWDVAFNHVTADITVTAQYAINSYTVRFEGYDGSLIEEQNVQHGSAATAPTAPAREGYTFTSWDVAFDNVTADITVTAQYDVTTALPQSSENKLNIYPNPATTQIAIANAAGETVSIYSLSGTLVKQVVNISNTQTIEVSDLAKGVYMLKVGATSQKLVIK